MPKFSRLPDPLFASTAAAMTEKCEGIIKSIKAQAKRVPIYGKTGEGTVVVLRQDLEPEAQDAIGQWRKRIDQISEALAG